MPGRMYSRLRGMLRTSEWRVKGRFILSTRRLIYFIYLKMKRKLHLDISFDSPGASNAPIDVYMPTIEKDCMMLPFSIRGIRENVQHPITNIYIVAPKSAKNVQRIAKQEKCVFIDEAEVLPFSKDKINYVHNGENRGGWIYKMLLNLNSGKVCTEKHILIVDSDTVFIRPQIFLFNDKPLFNLGDSYHEPYFEANIRIFGLRHRLSRSFITHYMLFDSTVLDKLQSAIEEASGKTWYDGIIDGIDTSVQSGFADYEIYGDFYREALKLPCILNCWSNISMGISRLDKLPSMIEAARPHYASVSLHNYSRN